MRRVMCNLGVAQRNVPVPPHDLVIQLDIATPHLIHVSLS